MSRDLVKNSPFESFPNYTDEMYLGNEPSSKGVEYITHNGVEKCDDYLWKNGHAEVINGKLQYGSVNIDAYNQVVIIGRTLCVQKMVTYKSFKIWKYWCNVDSYNPNLKDYGEITELDISGAMKILNKLRDCKIEQIIKKKAIELINKEFEK